MDNRKIAFIICSNNDLYYNECVYYINRLQIPTGWHTEILRMPDAKSMTAGYNEGMKASDAKYKVYLHQDVFLYNEYFIADIVKAFMGNEHLGMIGLLGRHGGFPKDARTWSSWNIGCCLAGNGMETWLFNPNNLPHKPSNIAPVDAIDGMLMATQYDLPWREDLGLGWDFYDVSQSLEFRKAGYQVGIPYQETPWCLHDCGYSKLYHIDESRKKMFAAYPDVFDAEFVPAYNREFYDMEDGIFRQMKSAMEQGNFALASEIKSMVGNRKLDHNDLRMSLNLLDIYEREKARGSRGFFSHVVTYEEMKEKYTRLKFLIRRIQNFMEPEDRTELASLVETGQVSEEAIQSVMSRMKLVVA